MTTKRYGIGILLALAASVGFVVAYARAQGTGRQTWEYMLIGWKQMGEAGLTRLGTQGWELVSVDTEIKSLIQNASGITANVTSETYFYFKRPK